MKLNSKHIIIIVIALLHTFVTYAKHRTINNIPPIHVTCVEGNAPLLPWTVLVGYNDGSHEWRQVRWTNSALAVEQLEADAMKTPSGSHYTVQGYIIGDNTTDCGFPVEASVDVVSASLSYPSPSLIAEPLPISDVELTGCNRLTSNRDLDIKALLALDVSQQLYNYRDTYGLSTEGYTRSDGWDSPTTKLKGHGTGHYMSALAFAFAGTRNDSLRHQLRLRMERMVNELRECQQRTFVFDDSLQRYREARDLVSEDELPHIKGSWKAFNDYKTQWEHYGYGYLNAIPPQHAVLVEMYRPYNNEEWVWAPYYSIHKQLAGLIDIALCIDDKDIADKALLIARDMGLWVWNRLHYRTFIQTEGSTTQRRAKPGNRYEMWNIYIAGEVGGMAESLSRLAELTPDEQQSQKLAQAATYFDAPAFFFPVMHNVDDVRTRHANQHIPMITGALRSYRLNGNVDYYNLANNFWHMMQSRYVYAMGGVGNGEMWRQPYSQMVSMNTNAMTGRNGNRRPNPDINETCCAYNLAKLTKDLNCFTPDDARLMDYYERVLYNQIVGSIHPTHYGVTYQYAVGLNANKPFGNQTPQESCCGGTGAENHVKYQEATYFANDSTLWVALYLPTKAQWRQKNVIIEQSCEWPAEKSIIKVYSADTMATTEHFAIKLRVPYWATNGFRILLNGKDVCDKYPTSSYVEIPSRQWHNGDIIEIVMPYTKHICYGADKMDMALTSESDGNTISFTPQWSGTLMYGPLVMTSPDIHTWEEASFNLSPGLDQVQASRNASNLFTLNVMGKTFIPDYAATTNSTHYLRLNIPSASKIKNKNATINTSQIKQLLTIANQRQQEQQAWKTSTSNNHAPWAPHGFERLISKAEEAKQWMASVEGKKKLNTTQQQHLSQLTSELNATIIAMRPGNLAEPEDLTPLIKLIEESNGKTMTQQLREAKRYALMVVQYVNDGSGTPDMIRKAMERMR